MIQFFTFCVSIIGILVGLIPKPVIAVIIVLIGYACLLVFREWLIDEYVSRETSTPKT
jgi:hypothetical protein